jgi:uncharacterized protein (TIGR00251 family)
MIIPIKVSPRASRALVQKTDEGYKVYCTKPAADGQANDQVIELIAKFFKVKKYRVRIVRGATSRTKLLEIVDE